MELSPSREAAIVQPLKNFPAFYWTREFITVFTRALHWSLSQATTIFIDCMLRNKSIFQISTLAGLSSISICNLLIDLPSYYLGWHDLIGMPTFDIGMRNPVRIQPNDNEEVVFASDTNAWRWCVASMSHLGGFCFNFTGRRFVLRLWKFVTIT
jgi:hypothetical protein